MDLVVKVPSVWINAEMYVLIISLQKKKNKHAFSLIIFDNKSLGQAATYKSEKLRFMVPCEALSKLLMSVLTVGEGSEEVEDRRLRPIPCLSAARSLSTAFM